MKSINIGLFSSGTHNLAPAFQRQRIQYFAVVHCCCLIRTYITKAMESKAEQKIKQLHET